MALDVYFSQDVAQGIISPVAAIWPRLTPQEKELVGHLVRCQLQVFGVETKGQLVLVGDGQMGEREMEHG